MLYYKAYQHGCKYIDATLFICLSMNLSCVDSFLCVRLFFVLVCFPYINQSVLKLNIVICYWRMIDDLWYWKLQPILLWYSNKRKQCHNIDNVILLTGRCTLMCVCVHCTQPVFAKSSNCGDATIYQQHSHQVPLNRYFPFHSLCFVQCAFHENKPWKWLKVSGNNRTFQCRNCSCCQNRRQKPKRLYLIYWVFLLWWNI